MFASLKKGLAKKFLVYISKLDLAQLIKMKTLLLTHALSFKK